MIKIHHLNVGHGDTILVEFLDTNRLMVIDINRSSDFDEDTKKELINEALENVSEQTSKMFSSGTINKTGLFETAGYDIGLTDPIEYIDKLGYSEIFRMIQTHPHMDHLSGLNSLFEDFIISNIWCHKNNFSADFSKLTDMQVQDWNRYLRYRDTNESRKDGTTIVRPRDNDSREYWNEDNITILSPCPGLIDSAHQQDNRNIMSYVILVEHAGHKIIFGADAEEETWDYIVDNYEEKIKDVSILDASHHGRDSGYHQKAVKLMNPGYVVVSVGKKPSTDASNKYRQYSDNVWSTRWKGNIVFTINSDGSGKYYTEYDR